MLDWRSSQFWIWLFIVIVALLLITAAVGYFSGGWELPTSGE